MGVSKNVTRWSDELERACRDVGVADELTLEIMLALVATESSGDPDVVNRFGFTGILQIGSPYLVDAREWFASSRRPAHIRALLDEIPARKSGLVGNVRASALVVCGYMERYEMRHGYDPYLVATIHKGGAGTAKTVSRLMGQGMSLEDALEEAEDRNPGLGNLTGYVLDEKHFAGHFVDYSEWVAQRDEQGVVEVDDAIGVCVEGNADGLDLIRRGLAMLVKEGDRT